MGCRSPLYCTSTGKLYLAWMSNSELDRYLKSEKLIPYTENTITDADSLRKVISTIREDGFASTNSEFVLGVIGAAVPVVDKTNRLLAGLAISVPSVRMAFADIPKLRPALAEAADALVHTFD